MRREFFAELLLNNRVQMGYLGVNVRPVTLTKEMKIGLCEQSVHDQTVSLRGSPPGLGKAGASPVPKLCQNPMF